MWDNINLKGTIETSNKDNSFPSLSDLCDQFQMKSETSDTSTLFSEITLNQHVPVLDEIDEIE